MYNKLYQEWKNSISKQEDLKEELLAIENDEIAIQDRFYKELEFGTGGLRGKLGAGTARMNVFTVAKVTKGIVEYINKSLDKKTVVIAYDSRNYSDVFSSVIASIFSKANIKTYVFKELMPTPILSYAVRQLNAGIGIVVTASHNPSAYNGYKVYGSDGCQLTDKGAGLIYKEIQTIKYDFNEDFSLDKVNYVKEDVLESFYTKVLSAVESSREEKSLSLVYTPLNGAGNKPVREILKRRGYSVKVVKEQELPDGNFPTCPYPNPEEREALTLGLKEAKNLNADLLLATDPDCDRVGIAVKDNGEYKLLSGNEVGILLLNYLFETWRKEKGNLEDKYIVKTIVSSNMAMPICAKYKVEVKEVLTGFKYIGEQIGLNSEDFLLGYEESYGYLCHTYSRDKDAVGASLIIVEMANYYMGLGLTLVDKLDELYKEFGYYQTALQSITHEGASGAIKIKADVDRVRNDDFSTILTYNNIKKRDFLLDDILPVKANVIELSNSEFTLLFRPSGTEPKMKIYYLAKGKDIANAKNIINDLKEYFSKYFNL